VVPGSGYRQASFHFPPNIPLGSCAQRLPCHCCPAHFNDDVLFQLPLGRRAGREVHEGRVSRIRRTSKFSSKLLLRRSSGTSGSCGICPRRLLLLLARTTTSARADRLLSLDARSAAPGRLSHLQRELDCWSVRLSGGKTQHMGSPRATDWAGIWMFLSEAPL
jgi:hypothetical protein